MAQHSHRPIEPPATPWQFPEIDDAAGDDLVAVGADLEPGTLLAAYRAGYFPMPLDRPNAIGWWSPDPRGVLEVDSLRVSRSLQRSTRRFEIRVDTAFEAVVEACADMRRPHGWITADIRRAYAGLHELGWAHSVECWTDDELVGGLYGVGIGAFFAGESMFHLRSDASKVALVALCDFLRGCEGVLLDVQWVTPHLERLGAVEMARSAYLRRLPAAIGATGPDWGTMMEPVDH